MGKASKARKRKGRQGPLKATAMDEDKPKTGKEKDEASDSRHSMFKRQAAEVKAVKHEIALLKQRRRKLRKKFVAEVREKREINKKIKALLKGLHEKHQREESAPQGEPQPNTNQTTAAAIEVDQ